MKKICLTQKIKNGKEKGYVLNNKIFLGEYNFEQSDSLSGVYTGDANCYPQHITKGKTAYVKGEKITGTYNPVYWDLPTTPTPSDKIMEGRVFYTAPGTQVVGTLPRFDLAVERSDSNAKITLSDDLVMSIPSGYIFGREPYSWGSEPNYYACRIIDVFSEATATKFDIKANVTAFTKEYDTSVKLSEVEGRIYPMSNYSLTEITPATDQKEIRSGNWNFDRFYTDSKTVLGDPNLIPENIKAGISIFGVQGTWLSENATATSNDIAYDLSAVVNYSVEHGSLSTEETFSFTPTSSYGISSKIYKNLTILPEENLKPENIMVGNTILGVEGAYTNDATATSGDFINYYELTSGQIFTKRNTGFVKGKQLYGSGDLIDRRHTILPYYEDKDGKFYMAKGFYSGTTGAIKTGSVGGNATPDSILLGKTAYVNGEKITGTLALKELDIYPSNVNQIYNDKGLYKIKINTPNSVNLKPENIKSGVDIWGVTGSYAPKESNLDERIFKCIEVDTSSKTFKGEVMTKTESYYKPSGTYINSIPYNLIAPEVGCYYLWGCYGKVTNIMLEQAAQLGGYNLTVEFYGFTINEAGTSYDSDSEKTVIRMTMQDTSASGLDRVWVSDDGAWKLMKYEAPGSHISWGLYKTSRGDFEYFIDAYSVINQDAMLAAWENGETYYDDVNPWVLTEIRWSDDPVWTELTWTVSPAVSGEST